MVAGYCHVVNVSGWMSKVSSLQRSSSCHLQQMSLLHQNNTIILLTYFVTTCLTGLNFASHLWLLVPTYLDCLRHSLLLAKLQV